MKIKNIWNNSYSKENIKKIFEETRISPLWIDMEFWLLDTLNIINSYLDDLYFKGGTCIKSYLPSNEQRFSNDLDFNAAHERDFVIGQIEKLNYKLSEMGFSKGDIGIFKFGFHDTITGTLTFYRFVPGLLVEKRKYRELESPFRGHKIKVQINVKHKDFPCLKSGLITCNSFLLDFVKPDVMIKVNAVSIEDLIADKVLASAKHEDILSGRSKFKDVVDLYLLFKNFNINKEVVKRKIITIYSDSDRDKFLNASSHNILNMGRESERIKGFSILLHEDVKYITDNWAESCAHVSENINDLI